MDNQLDPRKPALLLLVLLAGSAFAQEELPSAAPEPVVTLQEAPDKPLNSSIMDQKEDACACTHYSYSRYCKPCEHPLRVPRLGSAINAHLMTQVVNGMARQLVLREYDFDQQFNGNPVALNAVGGRQLRKISNLLTFLPGPVFIEESTRDPDLNARRRGHVIKRLRAMGVDFDPANIVVSTPKPIGLPGLEAEIIYQRLADQSRQGGAREPSASSGQGVVTPSNTGVGSSIGRGSVR